MITSATLVSTKVDWLSATTEKIVYPDEWTKLRKELRHGLMGYDTAIRYVDGRIELCSSNRKDMKPHIIFSGKCIDRLAVEHGINSFDIMRSMDTARLSRIDIAVDVKNGSLPISDIVQSFEDGNAVTRARSGLYLSGVRLKGETFYVGSKSSPRRIRIYDKAAESGITDFEWSRVEFQVRHQFANPTAFEIMSSEKPESAIPKIIKGFLDFPEIADWMIVMGSEEIKVSASENVTSNRRKWLFDTCVKSLASEMVESGDGLNLMTGFEMAVIREYERRKSEYK